MKTKALLVFFLSIMAIMILLAVFFTEAFLEFLFRPALYRHILFAHIFGVSLFFANAVIGILWELRSLTTGRKDVILHTYDTVAWLDARLSSFLIVITVITGIMLSIVYGDLWQIGWLSLAFLLFLLSGVIWVVSDIPAQYRIKKLMQSVSPQDRSLPDNLMRLLKMRLWISLAGTVPLLIVFILMVYKPEIRPLFGLRQ